MSTISDPKIMATSTNAISDHQPYRRDIDGLRALAVLFVVFYHAFPVWFKAGFIGVDIFFVISGYLITKIILMNLCSGSFNFADFYARRIRRIFPALSLVLSTTLVAGYALLQRDELATLLQHAASSGAFLLNLTLISEGGYFDRLAESKPLLNLWSLSVEEQFYIFWPFFLWVACYSKIRILAVILLLGGISLLLALMNSSISPVETFYSLSTRAWELLIGAGLAYTQVVSPESLPQKVTTKLLTSILGLLLLAISLSVIDPVASPPGYWIILPPVATALLICSQSDSLINRWFFSSRLLVWIGLISYPLYLWHWPILSLARIHYGGTLSNLMIVILVCLSFLLATLTYHFLEKPIRNKYPSKAVAIFFIFLMACITLGAYYFGSLPVKISPRLQNEKSNYYDYFVNAPKTRWLDFFERGFRHECNFYRVSDYHEGRPTNTPRETLSESCYIVDSTKGHRVLLWGDSHAQMLYSGLLKTLPDDWQILQVTSSGCAARIENLHDHQTDYCARSNRFALDLMKEVKPDVVVIAQSANHNADSMNRVTTALQNIGIHGIIFVGPSPKWEDDLPKILIRRLWPALPERTWVGVKREAIDLNSRLKNALPVLPGRTYVDVIGVFCNHNGCLTRIGEDTQKGVTSWDYGHLTEIASEHLAQKLLAPEILKFSSPRGLKP
jgi:peptidoglycan/LPS O-acetylase OafA/YrhL